MPITRRTFAQQDTDTDAGSLPSTTFRDALNVMLERGYLRGASGNVAVPYALPAGACKVVGAVWDAERQAAYYLLWHATTPRIVQHTPADGATVTVLEWAGLRLPEQPGRAQPCVSDGLLFYLDAAGETRCVPVARALSGFYTPQRLAAEPTCLHLLKAPPFAPVVTRLDSLPAGELPLVRGYAWQFAVQDRYADGEESLLSPYSPVLDLSDAAVEQATVGLGIALPQPVPTLVRERVVWARRDAETAWLAVATVAPTTAVVEFFGSRTGEALDPTVVSKTTESLWPAQALTVARNRLFVANLREGYPAATASLTAVVANRADTSGPDTISVILTVVGYMVLEEVENQDGTTSQVQVPQSIGRYFAASSAVPDDYYPLNQVGGSSSTSFAVPAGAVPSPGALVLNDNYAPFPNEVDGFRTYTVTTVSGATVTGLPLPGGGAPAGVERTLHERTQYQVGVQFYDALGRPGGATQPVTLIVPAQDATNPQGRVVQWGLPAGPQLEIPEWAESYHLLLSTNRTATSFVQGVTRDVQALLGYNTTTPVLGPLSEPHRAVAVDIGNWPAQGQGYTWAAGSGDRLRLSDAEDSYPIVGQMGDKLIIETSAELVPGTQNGVPVMVLAEIFTPRAGSGSGVPLLYERGPRYRVSNPGAPTRAYTVTAGVLDGDAYLVSRRYAGNGGALTTVEAMTPTAGKAAAWLDASRDGRPAAVLPAALQQTALPTALRFSGVRVAGTQTNGFARWDALNIEDQRVPRELGPVTALAVADDTQAQGSVLVVLARNGSASVGLGVSQARQAEGGNLLVEVDRVVGYVSVHHGGYGCQHPQTVASYGGRVFFFDASRQEWCRYARNGVSPLGRDHRGRNLLRLIDPSVLQGACYDPVRDEAWLLTGDDFTVVWDQGNESFAGRRALPAECALGVPGSGPLSWTLGKLYHHRADAPASTFNGRYEAPFVTVECGDQPGVARRYKAVAVEGDGLWVPSLLTTDTGQQSRTRPQWFAYRAGVYRAALRGNEKASGFLSPAAALTLGPPVQGTRLTVTLTAPDENPGAKLVAFDVSWLPLPAQRMGV